MNLLLQPLMETQPISDSQWSFQRGKSTVIALLETTRNWFEMLERGKEIEVGECILTLGKHNSIRFLTMPF